MATTDDIERKVADLVDQVRTLRAQVAWLEDQARNKAPREMTPARVESRRRLEPSLTRKNVETLRCIRDFWAKNGYGPTYQEIADAFGVAESCAYRRVESCRKRGAVAPATGRHRDIQILYDPDDHRRKAKWAHLHGDGIPSHNPAESA
jgi:hypothetical protein